MSRGPGEPTEAQRPLADASGDGPQSRAQARDRLYDAALDEMTDLLREQARGWAVRLELLRRLDDLSSLGAKAGVAQFPQLEMAGSWNVSQITATRWQAEAVRFAEALPRTLAMLTSGDLLEHQAKVLLHRTANCTVEVAQAVEEEVLPAGASLCPSDLSARVDRAVLRIESERADAAAAERRRAQAVAQRRTFAKPLPDGMALAGAVLTAEQMVGWRTGMDALERRERIADRDAGVERTAEQRRADLFAALPSMVLAGTAQDRAAVAAVVAAAAESARPSTSAPSAASSTSASVAAPWASAPSTGAPTAAPAADAHPAAPPLEDTAPTSDVAVAGPRPGTGSTAPVHSASDEGRDAPGPVAPDAGCSVGLRPWTLGPEQLAAQVVLNVLVPVSTVLDISREPGSLGRYGPVSAEHVRLLRPHSWRRVMVESTSGRPVAIDDRPSPVDPHPERAREQVIAMLRPDVVVDADEPQHDPSARLARLVDVRDVRCCGPGCAMTHTHRDHLEPYPRGATSASNLGRLSARCHRAKHAGWTLERHRDGSVTWTSPLGRVYDRPSPHAPPPHVDLFAELPPIRPHDVADPGGAPDVATALPAPAPAAPAGRTSGDDPSGRRTEPCARTSASADDLFACGAAQGADARAEDQSGRRTAPASLLDAAADDDLPPF